MKWSLLLFVLPMLAGNCNRQEVTWHNQQYIWVRANGTVAEDSVVIVRGRISSTTFFGGQRLYFVESACESFADWPDVNECLDSRITLSLVEGLEYDIYGWSEPGDRRTPVRNMTVFQTSWTCCNE